MTARARSVQHLQSIEVDNDWETPPHIYEQGLVIAGFTPVIDVCASHSNTKCKKFISIKQNVLTCKLRKPFFCNPPYEFVDEILPHIISEAIDNKTDGLVLVYAKTDTNWWANNVEGNPAVEHHFIKGRIPFYKNGKPYYRKDKKTGRMVKGISPYPSVWLVIRGSKNIENSLEKRASDFFVKYSKIIPEFEKFLKHNPNFKFERHTA